MDKHSSLHNWLQIAIFSIILSKGLCAQEDEQGRIPAAKNFVPGVGPDRSESDILRFIRGIRDWMDRKQKSRFEKIETEIGVQTGLVNVYVQGATAGIMIFFIWMYSIFPIGR